MTTQIVKVPTSSDSALPNYRQTVELDGRTFVLGLRYNQRDERWYLNVDDAAGLRLLSGIALVSNDDITAAFRPAMPALPDGALAPVDMVGLGRDPGLTDMGDDGNVRLFFIFDDGA